MNYFVFKEEVELYELQYLCVAWKRIKPGWNLQTKAVIKNQSSVRCGGGLGGDTVTQR